MRRIKSLMLIVAAILVFTPLCAVASAQLPFKIVYPSDGGNAGPTEPMSGTAPQGQTLRMVLFIPSIGKYYPQEVPVTVNKDGSWYYRCTIGGDQDNGKQFEVQLVTADASANQAFDTYIATSKAKNSFDGISALPAGATVANKVDVTRVATNVKDTAPDPIPSVTPTPAAPTPKPSLSPTPTPTISPSTPPSVSPSPTNTTNATSSAVVAAAATSSGGGSVIPGFEAVFALVGLVAAYAVIRRAYRR